MRKKQYLAKRKQLMDETQALIDVGKAVEAEEKMKEIDMLDEQWDAIAQAEANFNAMNKDPMSAHSERLEGTTDSLGQKGASNETVQKWESE